MSISEDPTPPPNTLVQQDSVVMIYGIGERFNCDHIFNLMCSYGNIMKVKVLTNKNGIAMAQLHSKQAANNAIRHLNQQKLMGNTIEISYVHYMLISAIFDYNLLIIILCLIRLSRHPFIADPPSGYVAELFDHSHAVKEYSHSRNNRWVLYIIRK